MELPTTADSVHARVGSILQNKWVLGSIIGSGGTAAVYEGTHRTNGRRVAVKVMHSHLASSPDVVLRFQREGYIANKVGHPGAVAILDNDQAGDQRPLPRDGSARRRAADEAPRRGRRTTPKSAPRCASRTRSSTSSWPRTRRGSPTATSSPTTSF